MGLDLLITQIHKGIAAPTIAPLSISSLVITLLRGFFYVQNMPLETTVNHIADLEPLYPFGTDNRLQGDNHIRNIKTALKNDLPLTTPATATGIALLTAANAAAARTTLGSTTVGDAVYIASSQAAAQSALGVYSESEVDALIAGIPTSTTPCIFNPIVNGDFAVDQEHAGASVTVTAGAALKYVIDGWYAWCTGANVTFQTTTVAGRKRARFTGAASNTLVGFATRMESINTADFASKFATISALFSSSSITTVNWGLYYATSTNAFGTVASPTRTTIDTGSFTITSTETAYSDITAAALASGATTGLELVFTIGALLGSETFTIGDVQIEKDSVASPIFTNTSYSDNLGRCKRLYFKYNGNLRAAATVSSGTQREVNFMFPTEMRVSPTITYGTWLGSWSSGPTTTITTQSFSAVGDVGGDAYGQNVNGFVADARL